MLYDDLVTAVGNDLNRNDLDSLIPSFIARAESDINAVLAKKPVWKMIETATISSSSQSVALPTNYMDAVSLECTDSSNTWTLGRLRAADLNNATFYNNRALPYRTVYRTDKPVQYAVTGGSFWLTPAPQEALDFTLRYYAKLDALSSSSTSNWMLESHENVYLFATVAHAAKHIRDDEYMQMNFDLFDTAITNALESYDENASPNGLRTVDAPWSINTFDIATG